MIILGLIIIAELIVLYMLSNHMTKILYTLFYALFRSKSVAVGLITFLYLPGTVIHEFAHLLVAEVLRVPTGELSFAPQIKSDKDHPGKTEVKMGSVQIGKTDPIRRYLIGFAPLLFGMIFLFIVIALFERYWPELTQWQHQGLFLLLIGYLVFTLSNNMFSSRSDLEGFLIFLPVMTIVVVALYIAGVRITLEGKALEFTHLVFSRLTTTLGIVIGVNLLILAINSLFLRGVRKFV